MLSVQKLIISLILLFASANLLAIDASSARTLAVTGKGLVSAEADMALISMQTTSSHKTANAAKNEVDKRINDTLAQFENQGIKRKDIIASTLRLTPDYEYNNRTRVFSGYVATRDIRVTIHKLERLDKILDSATTSGINIVQSIQLKSSKEDSLLLLARDEAIENSKEIANQLAKAYGAELGPVHSINYQTATPVARNYSGAEMMRVSADQSSGGQYLHDKISFRDQVQVVFELIPIQ